MQTPPRNLSDRYELKPGISKSSSSVSHDSLINTISIESLSIRIDNSVNLFRNECAFQLMILRIIIGEINGGAELEEYSKMTLLVIASAKLINHTNKNINSFIDVWN